MKVFFCLILLCHLARADSIDFIKSHSQTQTQSRQTCDAQQYSSDATECSTNNSLILSQFISNSSDYLANDTTLIFSPGNHSLESELVVENIHSFSMFVWPGSSSKTVINCHAHNARFEFSNVSTIILSGLEFVGCFENHVISVGHFQLENSGFFGNGQAVVSGTVLSIEKSTANLDRVVFKVLSADTVDKPLTKLQALLNDCPTNCTVLMDQIFSAVGRVTGISSRSSNISITHSRFEGNDVGLNGAAVHVISIGFGSDIIIINTTFVNNRASNLCARYPCYCCSDCNITSSIVHTNGHGSTVKIYDSKFVQNEGVIIFGENCDMHITHTRFSMNNMNPSGNIDTLVRIRDAKLVITHSTFTNNAGDILDVRKTNMSLSHSEFISNVYTTIVIISDANMAITHSAFTNNIGDILYVRKTNMSLSHSEFISNQNGAVRIHDGVIASIDHSKFINNTDGFSVLRVGSTDSVNLYLNEFVDNVITINGIVYIGYYTTAENLMDNVFINNSAAYEIYIASSCRQGLSLSLGSSRCIPCSEHWRRDLIGIVVAAFIAGIALVIFLLVLNMTVAVGTLNGILFYANIVAANADTYFLKFRTPDFVTVFIS